MNNEKRNKIIDGANMNIGELKEWLDHEFNTLYGDGTIYLWIEAELKAPYADEKENAEVMKAHYYELAQIRKAIDEELNDDYKWVRNWYLDIINDEDGVVVSKIEVVKIGSDDWKEYKKEQEND